MTVDEIKTALIENRNSFTQSIRHTYAGYQKTIDAVDKIPEIIKLLQKELPGHKLAAEWEASPECYDAGSIFVNIYFSHSVDIRKAHEKNKELYVILREKFPVVSQSVVLAVERVE
jgi:hypothetical protein